MRQDKPSKTAYKVALGIVTLGAKPGMERFLPPGIVPATSNFSVAGTMPGGRNLSIPGLAPKVTIPRATLYAVLLGLSWRTESPGKHYYLLLCPNS